MIVPVCDAPPSEIVPDVIPAPTLTAPAFCTFARFNVVAPEPLAISNVFVPEEEPSVIVPVSAVPPIEIVPVVIPVPAFIAPPF